jgi:hypothetical protein
LSSFASDTAYALDEAAGSSFGETTTCRLSKAILAGLALALAALAIAYLNGPPSFAWGLDRVCAKLTEGAFSENSTSGTNLEERAFRA